MIMIELVVCKNHKEIYYNECISFFKDVNYCLDYIKREFGFVDSPLYDPYYQLYKERDDYVLFVRVYETDTFLSFEVLMSDARKEVESCD